MESGIRPRINDDVIYVSYGTPGGEYGRELRAAKITSVGAWVTVEDSHGSVPGRPAPQPAPGERRTLQQEWNPDAVTLFVMNPGGLFLNPDRPVEYHSGRAVDDPSMRLYPGGTWHWQTDED